MTRPHEYGFTARSGMSGILPWNVARRLDERALCMDPDPEYRREVKARIEREASDAHEPA